MSVTNRKSRLKRNLGGEVSQSDGRFRDPFFKGPQLAELRTSIVLPERLIRAVLLAEVDRLAADAVECTRFFRHFFGPTAPAAEVESYVSNFVAAPPSVVMGYPRSLGDLPVFAIILTSEEEQEADQALGNYVGETLPGEEPPDDAGDQEYEGVFFTQMNSVHVYAQHPDQTLYLYHFAKLVLVGAREALHNAGMISPTYSGSELSPHEVYLPDNVFARVLNLHYRTLMTIPKLYSHRDARNLKVAGIFGTDIVVDGVRGAVCTYDPGEENGDG